MTMKDTNWGLAANLKVKVENEELNKLKLKH